MFRNFTQAAMAGFFVAILILFNSGAAAQGMGFGGGDFGMGAANFRGNMGHQSYQAFQVNIDNDVFTNRDRFMEITGGVPFVDDNGDGIADIVQNNELFMQMGFGPWMDENGDGIFDPFQTHAAYQALGMNNFVDVDGDGLCDNYEQFPMGNQGMMNFRSHLGPQMYSAFDVDTSGDVFVNPVRFMELTGGMSFVDDNGDGVADIVQNSELFMQMGFGPWMDENGDGIFDPLQTHEAYRALGMNNFVDVDGDGLCDNYEQFPEEGHGMMM